MDNVTNNIYLELEKQGMIAINSEFRHDDYELAKFIKDNADFEVEIVDPNHDEDFWGDHINPDPATDDYFDPIDGDYDFDLVVYVKAGHEQKAVELYDMAKQQRQLRWDMSKVEWHVEHSSLAIVTFSGKAGHGKDTALEMMQNQLEATGHKVLTTGYADALKDYAKNEHGWNGEKDEAGRTLLQDIGLAKREENPNYWVDKVIHDQVINTETKYDFVLIRDARFPNEIEAWQGIQGINAQSIHIERLGFDNNLTQQQKNHPSETSMDGFLFDHHIATDNLEALQDTASNTLGKIHLSILQNKLSNLQKQGLIHGENVEGFVVGKNYEVVHMALYSNDEGFAIGCGHDSTGTVFATWQFNLDANNSPNFMWGNYHDKAQDAIVDFAKRTKVFEATHDVKAKDMIEFLGNTPDTSITSAQRDAYGYTNDTMLPIADTEVACMHHAKNDLQVYALYSDDTEKSLEEVKEIQAHAGIYGVERDEWQNSKAYKEVKQETAFIRKNYTKQEYELANKQDILGYLQSVGVPLKKEGATSYRSKEYGNLVINTSRNTWYFNEYNEGGGGAVGLAKHLNMMQGIGRSEAIVRAVHELAGVNPLTVYRPSEQTTHTQAPKEPLVVPDKSNNNIRVINYLRNERGIDHGIIMDCIDKGKIFQTKAFGNVAFASRDADGEIKHISLRGTSTTAEKPFRIDVKNSDKAHPWVLDGHPSTTKVYVFESAIDAMSHATLCKINNIKDSSHRISLHGTSLGALHTFLQQNPSVKTIVPCLDGDEAGQRGADRIKKEFEDKGYTVDGHRPPKNKEHKDYNEMLLNCDKFGIKQPSQGQASQLSDASQPPPLVHDVGGAEM